MMEWGTYWECLNVECASVCARACARVRIRARGFSHKNINRKDEQILDYFWIQMLMVKSVTTRSLNY